MIVFPYKLHNFGEFKAEKKSAFYCIVNFTTICGFITTCNSWWLSATRFMPVTSQLFLWITQKSTAFNSFMFVRISSDFFKKSLTRCVAKNAQTFCVRFFSFQEMFLGKFNCRFSLRKPQEKQEEKYELWRKTYVTNFSGKIKRSWESWIERELRETKKFCERA